MDDGEYSGMSIGNGNGGVAYMNGVGGNEERGRMVGERGGVAYMNGVGSNGERRNIGDRNILGELGGVAHISNARNIPK